MPASVKSAVVIAVILSASKVQAETYQFATGTARYVINEDGSSRVEASAGTAQLRTADYPFAALKTGSVLAPASAIAVKNNRITATFGGTGTEADFTITTGRGYFVVQLSAVRGRPFDELCFGQVQTVGLPTSGDLLAVRWSEDFALSLLSLQPDLNARLGTANTIAACATAAPMPQSPRVALVVSRTQDFLQTIQRLERDAGLPSPTINGQWAKRSNDARTSYLFIDMDEGNVDEVIRYAQLGQFRYILIYSSTWSSSLGSYPINPAHFPHGQEGLRAVIEKCHRAGLKVGMHMLTSLVDKRDPLAHATPLIGLLTDEHAVLASPIDQEATTFAVTRTAETPAPAVSSPGGPADFQIENEIVHCARLVDSLSSCVRGYAGTERRSHPRGVAVDRLVEREGAYMADLRGSVGDQIAARISAIIDDSGFDMIYFDGGELNAANGPAWYWIGVQQTSILKRVRRELLVQGSGLTQWLWHFFARGTCDDFAVMGTRAYLDQHKIGEVREYYHNNFMPAEFGWIGFLERRPGQPATVPNDLEYVAVRMLAFDAPAGIETYVNALRHNGRAEETFRLFGRYERLRLGARVPDTLRSRLQRGEWRLATEADGDTLRPINRYAISTVLPAQLLVQNESERQPLRFRAEAHSAFAVPGDAGNIALLTATATLAPPKISDPMPGALGARVEFSDPRVRSNDSGSPQTVTTSIKSGLVNLVRHRAVAVTLRVDQIQEAATPVINVQLQSSALFRDHYIDLDFTGVKTIVVADTDVTRMLSEFRPDARNYAFKAALRNFNYETVAAVNIRWMRMPPGRPVNCEILRIEALAESDAVLRDVKIAIGSENVFVPITLQTGWSVELDDRGFLRWFDADGWTQGEAQLNSIPLLAPGHNTVTATGNGFGILNLTIWIAGRQVQVGEIGRDVSPPQLLRDGISIAAISASEAASVFQMTEEIAEPESSSRTGTARRH